MKKNTTDKFLIGSWVSFYPFDIHSYEYQLDQMKEAGLNFNIFPAEFGCGMLNAERWADVECQYQARDMYYCMNGGLNEDMLREGVTGVAADKVARDIIDGAGYQGCFGHGLGHGVGRYIHENPRLSQAAGDKTLVRGNIVTVEPGIYLAGKYGCRIEDMVAITENGIRNFTKSPKELIELY